MNRDSVMRFCANFSRNLFVNLEDLNVFAGGSVYSCKSLNISNESIRLEGFFYHSKTLSQKHQALRIKFSYSDLEYCEFGKLRDGCFMTLKLSPRAYFQILKKFELNVQSNPNTSSPKHFLKMISQVPAPQSDIDLIGIILKNRDLNFKIAYNLEHYTASQFVNGQLDLEQLLQTDLEPIIVDDDECFVSEEDPKVSSSGWRFNLSLIAILFFLISVAFNYLHDSDIISEICSYFKQ